MAIRNIKNIPKSIWLLFLAALYADNHGPLWLRPTLFFYSLVLFLVAHVTSVLCNAGELLSKERWVIIGVCLVLVEILNQITYWLAKRKPVGAVILRGILFWCIFTAGIGTYIYLTTTVDRTIPWSWNKGIGWVLFYLVLSWILPYYSLVPEFRFFWMHGQFEKSKTT